jgi:hypothetical protein
MQAPHHRRTITGQQPMGHHPPGLRATGRHLAITDMPMAGKRAMGRLTMTDNRAMGLIVAAKRTTGHRHGHRVAIAIGLIRLRIRHRT